MRRSWQWADFFIEPTFWFGRTRTDSYELRWFQSSWRWSTEHFDNVRLPLAARLVILFFSGIFSIRFHTILLEGGPPRARGWKKKKASHSGATYRISQVQEESPKYCYTNGTVFCHIQRLAGLEKSETLWTYIPERLFFPLRTLLNFWRNICETIVRWTSSRCAAVTLITVLLITLS